MNGFAVTLGFEKLSDWLFLLIGNADGSQGIEGLAIPIFLRKLESLIDIKAQGYSSSSISEMLTAVGSGATQLVSSPSHR